MFCRKLCGRYKVEIVVIRAVLAVDQCFQIDHAETAAEYVVILDIRMAGRTKPKIGDVGDPQIVHRYIGHVALDTDRAGGKRFVTEQNAQQIVHAVQHAVAAALDHVAVAHRRNDAARLAQSRRVGAHRSADARFAQSEAFTVKLAVVGHARQRDARRLAEERRQFVGGDYRFGVGRCGQQQHEIGFAACHRGARCARLHAEYMFTGDRAECLFLRFHKTISR